MATFEPDVKQRYLAKYNDATMRSGSLFVGPGQPGLPWETFEGITPGYGADVGSSPLSRIAIYRRAIWVYACVEAKSVPMSMVPLKLYQRTPDNHHNEVTDHPILDVLNSVNPQWDTASSIRYDTEVSLNIHGRMQWLKVRNRAGIVKELYGLPVQFTQIIPSRIFGEKVDVFRYQPSTANRVDYKLADIIYFRYGTPEQNAEGLAPLQVALETISSDISLQVAQNAMSGNAARPSAIVTVKPKWSESDYNRFSENINRKYAGAVNAGKIMVLDNADNVTFNKTQLTPREMEWIKEHESHAQDICVAFRVPPMIANDFSDAARLANAGAGHRFYWENTLIPELNRWEDVLNWQLLWTEDWGMGGKKDRNGEWGSWEKDNGYYLQHDLSGIQALREDENARAQRSQSAFGYGASIDEIRQMRGQDPLDDPVLGGTILIASNLVSLDAVVRMSDMIPDVTGTDTGSDQTETEAQVNNRGSKTGSSSLKTDLAGANDVTNKKRQESMSAGAQPAAPGAIRSELKRWESVYKKDTLRAASFISTIIPEAIQTEIRASISSGVKPTFSVVELLKKKKLSSP